MGNQYLCLIGMIPLPEIRSDPVPQGFGLADIDYIVKFILHQINTGGIG
jgi:hypothetical protein